MLVQFDRPLCPKHKLTLTYLCSNPTCICNVRLCLKCAQQHAHKTDIEDDFIKDTVYAKKIEIQTEIIGKQYQHLQKYRQQGGQIHLLSSKNQESLYHVEATMKLIQDSKKMIFKALEEFSLNHFEVRKKLNKVKNSHPGVYLQKLTSKKMIPILVNLSNQEGIARLKRNQKMCLNAIAKYQEFMSVVKKFGISPNNFMEGLGFKDNTFRKQLQILLCMQRGNRKVQICFDRGRLQGITKRKNSNSRDRRPGERNESPKKKLTLLGVQPRSRTNLGKQN